MKKVFSLLLVVAMLASLSLVAFAAPANQAGGMHTVVTETDTDITVEIYINNAVGCSGFTSILLTDAVTYVDGSAVLSDNFANGKLTITTSKAGQIKMAHAFTDSADFFDTSASELALTYKVVKVDPTAELSVADFSYGTSGLTISKITTKTGGIVAGLAGGNNFTSASTKYPANFTADYVDDRAPIVTNPFSATVAGTTITCIGKVAADVENYGVEFTAESTLEGARAQKYYGAMKGDTVSDGADGVKTFTFDGEWDGSFEIILEGVHAGAKELNFFVNDTIIADTNFTLTVE